MVDCANTIRNGALVTKGKYIIPISYVKSALLQEWMTNDYQLRLEVNVMHFWDWLQLANIVIDLIDISVQIWAFLKTHLLLKCALSALKNAHTDIHK